MWLNSMLAFIQSQLVDSKRFWSSLLLLVSALMATSCSGQAQNQQVNAPMAYPIKVYGQALVCNVDAQQKLNPIQRGVFGTNLEWFNEAGGLASANNKQKLEALAKSSGLSVARFPGGILADYYHWQDGTGPVQIRPRVKHPTDEGKSDNVFGSPEFFAFLKNTGAQGLITVNAGTGTPEEAAAWVAYANKPQHAGRARDGFAQPMHIPFWEVGNELYFPENAGTPKVGLTPEAYAQKYLSYAKAMRAQDPSIKMVGIGLVKNHQGPDSPYQDWSEVLLKNAASELDVLAVHNTYFPVMYREHQLPVSKVYPALWASPEAVDKGLTQLEQLIAKYEKNRKISIAITEWGALFSLPNVDNQWVDHVKTQGTGVYVARMLQVMMSHPKIEVANYFKLTDRSFMGWINYDAQPKVPFWVMSLYANYTGQQKVFSQIQSPTYDAPEVGVMYPQKNVAQVTSFASVDEKKKMVYVNFVNRSMDTAYPIQLNLKNTVLPAQLKVMRIQTKEPTAHNGRDMPPEWPYDKKNEPYSTAKENSIKIAEQVVDSAKPIMLAPFSVMTVAIPQSKK